MEPDTDVAGTKECQPLKQDSLAFQQGFSSSYFLRELPVVGFIKLHALFLYGVGESGVVFFKGLFHPGEVGFTVAILGINEEWKQDKGEEGEWFHVVGFF